MNIFVGGVNGVGKSTILRRAAGRDHNLEVIHATSALMQQLGITAGDYDALHEVPNAKRDQALATIMTGLVHRQTTKVRLIDGHYLNLVKGQSHQIVGPWIKPFDAMVLIEADPAVIWQRIRQDEVLRDRELFAAGASDDDKLARIGQYLAATKQLFEKLTRDYQLDHFVLTHNDDDLDRAAGQLINFIQTLNS